MDIWLNIAAYELMLFAAIGFLIGGVDDFVIDCIWIFRTAWRQLTVYSVNQRVDAATLNPPKAPGRIIVFVAAWDEAAVIGRMIDHAVRTFDHLDYRIYVGCYPNDSATIAAVNAVASPRVCVVVGDVPGPTTKADCLNTLWRDTNEATQWKRPVVL